MACWIRCTTCFVNTNEEKLYCKAAKDKDVPAKMSPDTWYKAWLLPETVAKCFTNIYIFLTKTYWIGSLTPISQRERNMKTATWNYSPKTHSKQVGELGWIVLWADRAGITNNKTGILFSCSWVLLKCLFSVIVCLPWSLIVFSISLLNHLYGVQEESKSPPTGLIRYFLSIQCKIFH